MSPLRWESHALWVCRWWRVVLDEAQMVGTGLGSVAVMAARLHSTHRWAVTGTPIGPGGLSDIQGLLRVLHHDPFSDPLKWKWCVANPYLTGTLAADISVQLMSAGLCKLALRHACTSQELIVLLMSE